MQQAFVEDEVKCLHTNLTATNLKTILSVGNKNGVIRLVATYYLYSR